MKSENKNGTISANDILHPLTRAPKAYNNRSFIHSPDGRVIRILAEYLEPMQHLERENIERCIIFFGSARTLSREKFTDKLRYLEARLEHAEGEQKEQLAKEIERFKKTEPTTQHYEDTLELSRLLTQWSLTLPLKKQFVVCTGGGPGIMEAANRGAFLAGGRSVGLNISLPFEQVPNQYISPELNFEFHYFFMRKLWFAQLASSLVVCPGGFGTFDEMWELLTLIQTKKISQRIPIILFGKNYWNNVFNFEYLVESGMINKSDLDYFTFLDSPEEAFEYLKDELTALYKL